MQSDPVGTKDDFNLYSYVSNDAPNAVDPMGETAVVAPVVVGGLIVIGACAAEVVCTPEQKEDLARMTVEVVRGLGDLVSGIVRSESSDNDEESESDESTTSGDLPKGDEIKFDDKIKGQMGERGWTEAGVREVTEGEPSGTSIDNTKGQKDPATVYGTKGEHVIVNDRTGNVVQVSNRNNPGWKPDRRIRWKEEQK